MPRTTFAKRKHLCPACQKAFTTSGHLLRHSKVHTGEKKHKCPFPGCQTSCSRQDNLQQHYRIHLSSGSRRSSSGSLAKPFVTATEIDDRLATAPLSDASATSPAHEIEPYTIVNSPPVLQIPGNDRRYHHHHHHALDHRFLPSPPNTPPPLVPANPRLIFQPNVNNQQILGRRRSTGTLLQDPSESSDLPLRPPSSSSCSSSGTSSPVPPFELFGNMNLLNGSDSSSSASSPYSISNTASLPIWVEEDHQADSQQQISQLGDQVLGSASFMVHDDYSKQSSYQHSYASHPILSADYFAYETLPGDTGPTVYPNSFQQQQSAMHPFDAHQNVTNFSALPAILHGSSSDYMSADEQNHQHQHHHHHHNHSHHQQQHFSIDHNQQLLSQVYDSYQMFTSSSAAFPTYCHANSPNVRSQSPPPAMSPFNPAVSAAASSCIIVPENLESNLDYVVHW